MSEFDSEDDSSVEVIEIDIYGIYPKIIDMTSLASLVYSERSLINENRTIVGELYDDEENRLTLGYERLHTIPQAVCDRFGPSLQILDISHNKIRKLDFLVNFPNLTSFIADNNLISEYTIFPHMPKLELLWLNHCKISKIFPWIKKLKQSCPDIKYLSLMGNIAAPSYFNGGTFYDYLQYRLFVISLFPTLIHLDDRVVTDDQRIEAKRLYRRPLFERLADLSSHEYPISTFMKTNTLNQMKLATQRMFSFLNLKKNDNSQRNFLV